MRSLTLIALALALVPNTVKADPATRSDNVETGLGKHSGQETSDQTSVSAPVILQCDGTKIQQELLKVATTRERKHYRIDYERKTLEFWTSDQRWGDWSRHDQPSTATISADSVSETSTGPGMDLDITINRRTGDIVETMNFAGFPSKFVGICKVVERPEELPQRF